jgi:hypothetical protein
MRDDDIEDCDVKFASHLAFVAPEAIALHVARFRRQQTAGCLRMAHDADGRTQRLVSLVEQTAKSLASEPETARLADLLYGELQKIIR